MCGIVGALGDPDHGAKVVEAASRTLVHRGPDGGGVWADPEGSIALAQRRLAILDLSEAGRQPMASASGRFQLVYNGEIYNHLELRQRLGACSWRGHSDTETLLGCFEAWGAERTLQATVGMFALALFDRATRRLTLARDRLGEKPLYYGRVGRGIAFASELKALRVMPGFDPTIDRLALREFMQCGYVPSPLSIYASIQKLPPGTWLEIDGTDLRSPRSPKPYWSAAAVARAGVAAPIQATDVEAIETTERLLGDAVEAQMLSDVPLGALLSGGVDSSSVVALMQQRASRPVRTFSIGYSDRDYDESRQAAAVARYLGTDHTELIVAPDDALELIPRLPDIYDEPFADASQLPTAMVMSLARRNVTVALSGDGGDELFGGYNRHHLAARVWPQVERWPLMLRALAGQGLRLVRASTWDELVAAFGRLVGKSHPVRMAGEKLHLAARVLCSPDGQDLYRSLTRRWSRSEVVLGAAPEFDPVVEWPGFDDLASNMMLIDATTYLPDDVLVKVDRAAMAASLECRAPLLDHRLFEFAWRLPRSMRIRGGTGKWILREVLYRHVPRDLVERPKMGFAVPLGSWLRGALRPWAENLLAEDRLIRAGYLEPTLVRRCWLEHLSGREEWAQELWRVLMFEAWRERVAA